MLHLRKLSIPFAVAALSALGTVFSASAQAQTTTPITVVNSGFENPPISGVGTTGNTPPGWTFNGDNVDTSGNYFTGEQSGDILGKSGHQYGFIYAAPNGFNLKQDTGFFTTVGDTYTLTADINTSAGAYAVILLSTADGVNSALSAPLKSDSAFSSFSTTFTATSSSDLLINLYLTNAAGSPSLGGTQEQDNFDNIRLVQVAPVAAPEPSAWVGLVVGAMGLGALSLRARRRSLLA